MAKVVKYSNYAVHPIEMKQGDLAEIVKCYNNWLPAGTIVIRIVNGLYVVGEEDIKLPDNILLNRNVEILVRILRPGTTIEL